MRHDAFARCLICGMLSRLYRSRGKMQQGCKVNVFWPIIVRPDSLAFRAVVCDVQGILWQGSSPPLTSVGVVCWYSFCCVNYGDDAKVIANDVVSRSTFDVC